jgi:hypothetical protein
MDFADSYHRKGKPKNESSRQFSAKAFGVIGRGAAVFVSAEALSSHTASEGISAAATGGEISLYSSGGRVLLNDRSDH